MIRQFHLPDHLRAPILNDPFMLAPRLDLEIGCGVGMHSIQRALEYPERNLIAIEHTRVKFEKFERRLQNHEAIPNLRAIHDNAISWVANHLPDNVLEEIFILYPNPNPKRRNQRWFCMPFMGNLLSKLKSGGVIHLATNEKFYFDEAKEVAQQDWQLQIIEERLLQATPGREQANFGRTHFERKYLQQGQTCFDVTFQKS